MVPIAELGERVGRPRFIQSIGSAVGSSREIHHEELGHLSVGSPADIAVLRLIKGDFGFLDARGTRIRGSQKLVAELTIRAGRVVWDLNGLAAADWQSTPVRSKRN